MKYQRGEYPMSEETSNDFPTVDVPKAEISLKQLKVGLRKNGFHECGLCDSLGIDSSYLYVPFNVDVNQNWVGFILVHLKDGVVFLPVTKHLPNLGFEQLDKAGIRLLNAEKDQCILQNALEYMVRITKRLNFLTSMMRDPSFIV
jgi:hypothetical protein